MFDLFKDIEKYRGITPYASEQYGLYQPLLGWQSKLTKDWIKRGGPLIDPQIQQILDRRLRPGPTAVRLDDPREFVAEPLQPASGRSPFTVVVRKDLHSELIQVVRERVETFVQANSGRLPRDAEWAQLININDLMDADTGALRLANDRRREQIQARLVAAAGGQPISGPMREAAKAEHLAGMRYESQIATFLLAHVEGQDGLAPDGLLKLFAVHEAASLQEILRSSDPLATIDPNDRSGALSPVGFVHLFRQYFFDLGTFLGEPVEHVWLPPGTSIELIEVSTRRALIESSEEISRESTTRTESSSEVKDELSDAIKTDQESSTKLGFSTTNTINFGVYQGTASATIGIDSARKDARETITKSVQDHSQKVANEIKASYKSVFRTVTESTDTRSRRYVLQNTGEKLVNYELRRKMRRVGVQLQDLGQRLCWQVFVDDPGVSLGLADLVHFAESPDLASIKQPEIGPPPAPITTTVAARIPFIGMRTNDQNGPGSDYGNTRPPDAEGKQHGNRTNTDDEDAEDYEIVMGPFHYTFAPPQTNYTLSEDIRVLGPQGGKRVVVKEPRFVDAGGSFDLVLDMVNFGGASEVVVDVQLVFKPTLKAFAEYDILKADAQKKYDAERQRLMEQSYKDSIRKRIKDASNIRSRPAWDLREEERTVIYRALLERLMLDSWALAVKNPKDGDNKRLAHVRSEVIRAIFDVDGMLYFVAPEWWMPRRRKNAYVGDSAFTLTNKDVVTWDDVEKRDDNYRITEESTVAKLGSSLGWLLQFDGDNLRNAFLNAPWVKAVVPIRPGREKAALNWLHALEGHGDDGWDTTYVPGNDEDTALVAELEAEGLPATIGNVLEKIADRLAQENGDIENTLRADKVFEHGFDHLAGGFDAGLPAKEVFSQWISVLPTDQLVAVDYEPTTLFEP